MKKYQRSHEFEMSVVAGAGLVAMVILACLVGGGLLLAECLELACL